MAGAALAADSPKSSTPGPEAACTHTKIESEITTAYLPKLRDGAVAVRRVLCEEGGKREQIVAAFTTFVDQLVTDKWFSEYGGFQNSVEPLQEIQHALETGAAIPTISLTNDDKLEVAGHVFGPATPDRCNARTDGRGCGPVFDEFVAYYTYAHNSFSTLGAEAFARTAASLSKQWSVYLDSSRSMTPLELLINSALYKRSETLQFSPPPRIQYIVLHPSLVIENVRAAIGGEKMKEALMIELGGANWWQQNRWYLPTGGSVITVYADRPGVTEFGYGLALHFRSVYSVGYTRHDNDSGVFISFDLLKLVQDKKKVLETFNP
jgi:hypothetical protein